MVLVTICYNDTLYDFSTKRHTAALAHQGFKLLHQELQAPIIQILQVDLHPTKTGSGMALFLCLSYAKKSWDDNNPHVRWDEICRSGIPGIEFSRLGSKKKTLQCVIVSFTTACWKAMKMMGFSRFQCVFMGFQWV